MLIEIFILHTYMYTFTYYICVTVFLRSISFNCSVFNQTVIYLRFRPPSSYGHIHETREQILHLQMYVCRIIFFTICHVIDENLIMCLFFEYFFFPLYCVTCMQYIYYCPLPLFYLYLCILYFQSVLQCI